MNSDRLDAMGELNEYALLNYRDADYACGSGWAAQTCVSCGGPSVAELCEFAHQAGLSLQTYLSAWGPRTAHAWSPREELDPFGGVQYTPRNYEDRREWKRDAPATFLATADAIAAEFNARTWADGCFLDNVAHPSSDPHTFAWGVTTAWLRAIRNRLSKPLTVNISASPWMMGDLGIRMLAGACDRVAFEFAFDRQWCRRDPQRLLTEVRLIRTLMAQGTEVWLYATQWGPFDPLGAAGRDELMERSDLAALAMLCRPGPIFVVRPFFEPVAPWVHLPKDLGEPRGEARLDNGQITREFANGSVTQRGDGMDVQALSSSR